MLHIYIYDISHLRVKVGLMELGDEESRRMEMAQGRLEWHALNLAVLDLLCFMLRQCQFF